MAFPDPVADRLNIPRPVVVLATNYPDGHVIPFHQHERCQLLHGVSGVMTVTTEKGIWVIPPNRAVWLPALMPHQIAASGELMLRSVFINPDAVPPGVPSACTVVSVSPLLRELILHAVSIPKDYRRNSPEERILKVILDRISALEVHPLTVPIPKDRRLKSIFRMLLEDPADNRTLEEWGVEVGATSRNLARLFRAETGMSFGQWRQQLRMMEGLKGLALKEPVTSVALRMGYNSPSAFIAVFKKYLGDTPGEFFKS